MLSAASATCLPTRRPAVSLRAQLPFIPAASIVKIGLRSNLVANLTGNTDFADSDVDVQQFNLTPYKLFFPEKRQFFLENAGVFAFPMGVSQHRRSTFLQPPDWD